MKPLSASALGRQLGISSGAVMRLHREGVIPAVISEGRLIRFDAVKCAELLAERAAGRRTQQPESDKRMGKVLHPQLLLSASPGFAKLQKLPISMQERYIEEPVPLVVHTDNGTDILLVKAKDMTKEQAAQVFGSGRIRTEGEQKAWLIQQRSEKARPIGSNLPAWRIRNGKVEFIAGATLTAGELATIITQITK
jgi:hypothetical protein